MSVNSVTPTVTTAPVVTAWSSKINWTQAVGVVASFGAVLTSGRYNVPVDVQAQIVLGIQSVIAVVTWVQRTWFTTTITPSSLPAK